VPFAPKDAPTSVHTVLKRVIDGPPRRLHELAPQTPVELIAICEKAMARDKTHRYPQMLAMAEDLRAYLEHRVVKAYRTGAVIEFRKWVQRNKGMAAAIAVATFVAIGGLAGIAGVQAKERKVAEANAELARQNEQRANTEAARAKTQEERATRETKRALSLSAIKRLQELRARADHDLWPRRSEEGKPLQGWLAEAQREVERLPQYEAYLAEVRSGGDSDEERWLEEKLSELIAEVKSFENGLVGDVEARLTIAKTMAAKTIDEQTDEWN